MYNAKILTEHSKIFNTEIEPQADDHINEINFFLPNFDCFKRKLIKLLNISFGRIEICFYV